jgi:hypothetical protein
MDVLIKYNQTRAYVQRQRKHEFEWSGYAQMNIKMSKGMVNFTFDVPKCTLLPAYRMDVSKLL